MARGVNKVILVGNLGKDPEVRYLPERFSGCQLYAGDHRILEGQDQRREAGEDRMAPGGVLRAARGDRGRIVGSNGTNSKLQQDLQSLQTKKMLTPKN